MYCEGDLELTVVGVGGHPVLHRLVALGQQSDTVGAERRESLATTRRCLVDVLVDASGAGHARTLTAGLDRRHHLSDAVVGSSVGISRSISSSHVRADMSEGARQSPRGESEPPAETFGPLGSAERLNWLKE